MVFDENEITLRQNIFLDLFLGEKKWKYEISQALALQSKFSNKDIRND